MRLIESLLLASFFFVHPTWAQIPTPEFAGKTIRLVVQFPPGGVPDTLARLIGTRMGESLGATVVVDNKPGATGAIAAQAVRNAAPDGLTLLLMDSSTYSISPFLKQLPFDPLKDFEPISVAAQSLVVLISNPGKAGSVRELISLAKSNPGLPFASSGIGSVHHLALEMLKARAGIDLLHVPYKGTAESVPAVVNGDVIGAFAGLNSARSFEKTGKVKILATVTAERTKLAPDVPTFAEAGLPGLTMSVTFGLFAPPKTSPAIVRKIGDEMAKVAASPAFRDQIAIAGLEPASSTPQQLRELVEKEQQTFREVIKTANIKVE